MQMPGVTFDDLLGYTDWQRHQWFQWMQQSPSRPTASDFSFSLAIGAGAN